MKITKEVYLRWLKFYKDTHKKGIFINECIKNKIVEKESERHMELLEELDYLLGECAKFLDKNRIYARSTKWQYNKDDKKTWISHESFAYHHLM